MTVPFGAPLADCRTAAQALAALERLFQEAALHDSNGDARRLLCAALEFNRLDLALRPDTLIDDAALERLRALAMRRLRREPVTRILGARGFWSIDLDVHENVLDPRPDTEIVVEAALEALGSRTGEPLRILDVGTGSGALIAAILSELPNAAGWGIDISPHAVAAARWNLSKLELGHRAKVLQQGWATPLALDFDLVVSNPPYIETAAIAGLDPEVRDYDPRLALDGGPDGLDAYRELAGRHKDWLKPGGVMVVEIGATQAQAVRALFEASGAHVRGLRQDYAGRDRALVLG